MLHLQRNSIPRLCENGIACIRCRARSRLPTPNLPPPPIASLCALRQAGIGEGDRVAIWSRNDARMLQAIYGALRCKAVFVPLSAQQRIGKRRYCDVSAAKH